MDNVTFYVGVFGAGMAVGVLPGMPDAIYMIRRGIRFGWLGPLVLGVGASLSAMCCAVLSSMPGVKW